MPFDFQKLDAKCSAMTIEELQREWAHYTRLISGAATSTAVSGLAMPLTCGVSAIGVGLAAPAIHNARKKREIIEKHLNRLGSTHNTRKRDVLAPMAISGTVGVVTLGVGSVGADAITNKAAEHGMCTIVENELMVKATTHLALDVAVMAGEEEHMKNKKAAEAFNAAQKAAQNQIIGAPAVPYTPQSVMPFSPQSSHSLNMHFNSEKSNDYLSLAPMPAPPPYTPNISGKVTADLSYFPPPPGQGPQPVPTPALTPDTRSSFSPTASQPSSCPTPMTPSPHAPGLASPDQRVSSIPSAIAPQISYANSPPPPAIYAERSFAQQYQAAPVSSPQAYYPAPTQPTGARRSQNVSIPPQSQQVQALSDQLQRLSMTPSAPSPAPYQYSHPTLITSPVPQTIAAPAPSTYLPGQPIAISPAPSYPSPQPSYSGHAPIQPNASFSPPPASATYTPIQPPSDPSRGSYPQPQSQHRMLAFYQASYLTPGPTPQSEPQQYFQSSSLPKAPAPQQNFYPTPVPTPESDAQLYFPPPPRVPVTTSA